MPAIMGAWPTRIPAHVKYNCMGAPDVCAILQDRQMPYIRISVRTVYLHERAELIDAKAGIPAFADLLLAIEALIAIRSLIPCPLTKAFLKYFGMPRLRYFGFRCSAVCLE